MTILYPELIALNELQSQFEEVAREQGTSPFIKLREMGDLLDNMADVLKRAELIGAHLAADAADHILDFIARDDLSMKWVDAAFDESQQGEAFKKRLVKHMDKLKAAADEYDRMAYERFTLPPEPPSS